MIRYWTNFDMVEELPDWTGVALTAGSSTKVETVQRVLADPRSQQLAGLKVFGDAWNGKVGQAIHEQTFVLPAMESLIVSETEAEDDVIPLQKWLNLFPGLQELHFEKCRGRIEPCRHLCLEKILVYNTAAGGVDLHKLEAFCTSVYPQLEELSLGFLGNGDGAELGIIERCLPSILCGEAFPRLNLLRLNLVKSPNVAEQMLGTILAQTELAPKLETIVLWDWPSSFTGVGNVGSWKFVDRLSYPPDWDRYG